MAKPKLICEQEWEIVNSKSIRIHSYTADWCGPCKQIKPYIEKLQREGKLILASTRTFDVSEKREGLVIPCFDMVSATGGKIFGTLQTSDPAKLYTYLGFDFRTLEFDEKF